MYLRQRLCVILNELRGSIRRVSAIFVSPDRVDIKYVLVKAADMYKQMETTSGMRRGSDVALIGR